RRRAWLERFVRAYRLCGLCAVGDALSRHRIQIESTDAAARTVPQPRFQRDVFDRSLGQYRLLRPDLRLQPLFPTAQSSLAVANWARLRANEGGGSRGSPQR